MIGFLYEIFNIFKKPVTVDYTYHDGLSPKARGIPAFYGSVKNCKDCKLCKDICPTKCISSNREKLDIDYGACLQCGLCTEVCPTDSLNNSGFVDVYSFNREDLKVTYTNDGIAKKNTQKTNDKELKELADLHSLIHDNGFNFREVCAGSNTGVEWEIGASYNNVFDMESIGVRAVASPKHAEILLVAGPVSENMEHALNVAWGVMPSPKAVVAIGTDSVSGGMFNHGKFPDAPKFWIAGDPPKPDVMVRAFLTFMKKRDFDFKTKWNDFINKGK
jgi:Ni,Fe-hydrogenase III small subunit/formate hydrogenlyase subunit 6/NADH:ubiquinone oxidoreductase subunit I